jgi:hypothetical protein
MKTLKQLTSAVMLSMLASTAVAQTEGTDQTTDNLITNTWSNTVPYTGTGGGYDGGYQPGYNPSTNTIYFGWTPQTVAETIAINQALSGTGIQISGYNYSWQYFNFGESRGSLTGQIILTDPTGISLRTYSYSMPVQGNQWYTQSGTQNFGQLYPLPSVGGLEVSFTGVDDRGWAGYYGPQIRNVNVSLNYSVDQCSVDPQSSPSCSGYKTYYTMGDDGYSIIPLPFGYPFYGRTFTHSIMFDNGVVSFYDPLTESARLGGQNFYSQPLSNNIGSQFHYSIMPLWTDLAPDSNTRYYTQTDSTNFFKYTWENIPQWGQSNRRNTFGLEIRPSGYLGIQYDQINIEGYPITAGVVGNAGLGEWTQHFRSEGTAVVTGGISNWSMNFTQPTDCSDPLSNPACPGYAEAYQQQQCTVNPLYSTSCPGYQQAHYDQQCSINPLYDVNCPGYATAYYDYQCSIDPLYHTGCPGYETAYFDQQCSISPLYDSGCTGYTQAYFDQQCGLNALYSTQCPLYEEAYYVQQCTISPLYDSGCTGYTEAYALKYIINSTTTEVVVNTTTEQTSTTQLVSDPAVNQTLTTTTTSVSPSQPVAPVQLVAAPQPAVTVAAAAKTEETKEEAKAADSKESTTITATASSSDNKDQPKTTRQQLAERRLEAARAKAVEDGKQLAGKMGEAASLEAQIQVQGVVMAAMGFVPGFDAYGRVALPDVAGYKPFEIYRGQRNIDNPAGRRFLTGADRMHQEMVDAQYR